MKLCVTRHWLELANQRLEATRRFLWLDSDSTRASHDSDSTWKNFRWLWLDENDSDTSLPTRKTFFSIETTWQWHHNWATYLKTCGAVSRIQW